MNDLFSEDEAVARVARLTRPQLVAFVEAHIVTPVHSDRGPVYRRLDLARMELLCDLSDEFDLDADALGIVISLVDQLHGVRAELRCLVEAIAAEPPDVRARLSAAARRARSTP
jgi:chaperone modulatory protein CbpM